MGSVPLTLGSRKDIQTGQCQREAGPGSSIVKKPRVLSAGPLEGAMINEAAPPTSQEQNISPYVHQAKYGYEIDASSISKLRQEQVNEIVYQ